MLPASIKSDKKVTINTAQSYELQKFQKLLLKRQKAVAKADSIKDENLLDGANSGKQKFYKWNRKLIFMLS